MFEYSGAKYKLGWRIFRKYSFFSLAHSRDTKCKSPDDTLSTSCRITWPLLCWSLHPFSIPRISSSSSQVQLNCLQVQTLIHCCCSNPSYCSGCCCCSLIGSVVAITPVLLLRRPAAVAYSYALPLLGGARVRCWRGSLLENRCTCWRDRHK